MEDEKIIDLYWKRDEDAITQSSQKYGAYCYRVALNILTSHTDCEECLNDTWLRAWNAIPPERPSHLKIYLARITRNLSLDRFRSQTAEKRGGGEAAACLDELEEIVPGSSGPEEALDEKELKRTIREFLDTLPARERGIFLLRYFYAEPIPEIALRFDIKETNCAMILSRIRARLKAYLKKEGYFL